MTPQSTLGNDFMSSRKRDQMASSSTDYLMAALYNRKTRQSHPKTNLHSCCLSVSSWVYPQQAHDLKGVVQEVRQPSQPFYRTICVREFAPCRFLAPKMRRHSQCKPVLTPVVAWTRRHPLIDQKASPESRIWRRHVIVLQTACQCVVRDVRKNT